MKRVGLWSIGIGLVIAVGLLTVEQGYADEKEHAPRCTLKTLKGRYLFGGIPPGIPVPTVNTFLKHGGMLWTPKVLFVGPGQGRWRRLGRNRFEAHFQFDIFNLATGFLTGTEDVTQEIHLTGRDTYEVNGNCTGSLTLFQTEEPGDPENPEDVIATFGLFIAPNGESIVHIATAPIGTEISDTSWRVSRRLR